MEGFGTRVVVRRTVEGGGETKTEEPIHQELSGPNSLGGAPSSTWTTPPPRLPRTNSDTVVGASPQAPGIPVMQSQGRPAKYWLEPVGVRRSVKVHCLRR